MKAISSSFSLFLRAGLSTQGSPHLVTRPASRRATQACRSRCVKGYGLECRVLRRVPDRQGRDLLHVATGGGPPCGRSQKPNNTPTLNLVCPRSMLRFNLPSSEPAVFPSAPFFTPSSFVARSARLSSLSQGKGTGLPSSREIGGRWGCMPILSHPPGFGIHSVLPHPSARMIAHKARGRHL